MHQRAKLVADAYMRSTTFQQQSQGNFLYRPPAIASNRIRKIANNSLRPGNYRPANSWTLRRKTRTAGEIRSKEFTAQPTSRTIRGETEARARPGGTLGRARRGTIETPNPSRTRLIIVAK